MPVRPGHLTINPRNDPRGMRRSESGREGENLGKRDRVLRDNFDFHAGVDVYPALPHESSFGPSGAEVGLSNQNYTLKTTVIFYLFNGFTTGRAFRYSLYLMRQVAGTSSQSATSPCRSR